MNIYVGFHLFQWILTYFKSFNQHLSHLFLIFLFKNCLKSNENILKLIKKEQKLVEIIKNLHYPLIRIQFRHQFLNRTEFGQQICHRILNPMD